MWFFLFIYLIPPSLRFVLLAYLLLFLLYLFPSPSFRLDALEDPPFSLPIEEFRALFVFSFFTVVCKKKKRKKKIRLVWSVFEARLLTFSFSRLQTLTGFFPLLLTGLSRWIIVEQKTIGCESRNFQVFQDFQGFPFFFFPLFWCREKLCRFHFLIFWI